MWTVIALWLPVASASDFDALLADSGWESIGVGSTKKLGEVPLEVKIVDGERCLRGTVTVDVAADALLDVVTDIPAAHSFTREKLLASRVLGQDGDKVHYYQHLDIPGWTMASDRYWVLEGWRRDEGDTRVFVWERFDWRSTYPELVAELKRDHPSAVEPSTNFGAWRFAPAEGGTVATYHLCSNPGGSVPEWVVKAGATKTFPNTISDVVAEARRRAR